MWPIPNETYVISNTGFLAANIGDHNDSGDATRNNMPHKDIPMSKAFIFGLSLVNMVEQRDAIQADATGNHRQPTPQAKSPTNTSSNTNSFVNNVNNEPFVDGSLYHFPNLHQVLGQRLGMTADGGARPGHPPTRHPLW